MANEIHKVGKENITPPGWKQITFEDLIQGTIIWFRLKEDLFIKGINWGRIFEKKIESLSGDSFIVLLDGDEVPIYKDEVWLLYECPAIAEAAE